VAKLCKRCKCQMGELWHGICETCYYEAMPARWKRDYERFQKEQGKRAGMSETTRKTLGAWRDDAVSALAEQAWEQYWNRRADESDQRYFVQIVTAAINVALSWETSSAK
jgi:hypothetical protein